MNQNVSRNLPAVPIGQKEPKPGNVFTETIGTLTGKKGSLMRRKKSMRENMKLEEEAQKVRDESPSQKRSFREFRPETNWESGEERAYLDPRSMEDPLVKELTRTLTNWLNAELGDARMKIEDLQTDLSDGLAFKILFERLSDSAVIIPMPMGELVQSEERQKRNLTAVVAKIEEITGPGVKQGQRPKWSANAIFDKNLLSIVFFLLHLVDHFTRMGRVSVDLPKAVRVNVIRLTKKDGAAHPEKLEAVENIIGSISASSRRDNFDVMIDHEPDKLIHATKEVVKFVNAHLGQFRSREKR